MKAVEISFVDFNKNVDTIFSSYWKILIVCGNYFQGTLISGRSPTLVPLLTNLTILLIRLKPSVWAKSILRLARPWQGD